MKYFWFLIAVLVLAGCWITAGRVYGFGEYENKDGVGVVGVKLIELPAMVVREEPVVEPSLIEVPVEVVEAVVVEEVAGPVVDTRFEDAMEAMLAGIGQGQEGRGQSVEQKPVPKKAKIVGPVFEVLDDGGVIVDGVGLVGDGSEGSPLVLSWGLLKSVGLVYEPRKGKGVLPDWLGAIDGKHVMIEGHTLVPVIASSSKELVVMENPWDGCCLGVPPTPFDAVEVRLVRSVDFGSSSVGYGEISGVFRVDPYVVSGWVMGLFVIEEGAYRSAPGTTLREF